MKKMMRCVNNWDYEDCLTLDKIYEVEICEDGMKKFIDDNGESLQTMLDRFENI